MDVVLLFAGAGLLAGFLSGLLGIGGGLVLIPVFAAVFAAQGVEANLVMPLTMGTSLATIIFTCTRLPDSRGRYGHIRHCRTARRGIALFKPGIRPSAGARGG